MPESPANAFTILHVLAPAPAGGLESVVRALAAGHRARGHRVVVAASVDSPEHPFVRAARAEGIDVVPFTVRARDVRHERATIARLIHTTRPSVVHTHGYRPDILDLPLARRQGVPTVTTLHGFTGGNWKLRLYERLQRRAIRGASAVIAVSRSVAERAARAGVAPRRLHQIANASSPATLLSRGAARAHLGISGSEPRIAWIGRMSQEKGGDVMLDALAAVRDLSVRDLSVRDLSVRDLSVTLSFIGDGPDRAALHARAQALGVADRVQWHGLVPDAARLLAAFDVFVLSSRTEGTPMVLLEAMAARLPIVATRVGGVPDMLGADDAWLVAPDAPSALADAIRAAVTDPDQARARAARARARLDAQFDMPAWLAQYEAVYASIQP